MRSLSTGLRNALLGLLAGGDGSFRDIMDYGVIRIYSGAQPGSSDEVETGTLLCTITLASGAFTPGVNTNGLRFGDAAAGIMSIKSGDVWSGVPVADGSAGYFRHYANDRTTGASTTAIRYDGSISITGAGGNLTMPSVTITTGVPITINSGTVEMAA